MNGLHFFLLFWRLADIGQSQSFYDIYDMGKGLYGLLIKTPDQKTTKKHLQLNTLNC